MSPSRRVPLVPLLALVALGACRREDGPGSTSRAEATGPVPQRQGFHTRVQDTPTQHEPAPTPPADLFEVVKVPAPLGENVAYITPVRAGPKRPAVLWLNGGFDGSIGASAWRPAPRTNDQSARAFREAGLVLMRPSLRGGNTNPGAHEYFLGEVDDVLAALEFLAHRPDVDPEHIYLGGHSTGGTLALLVAASGPKVAGVISFGPIDDVSHYGRTNTALDHAEGAEVALRSPVNVMERIRVPTLVIEGAKGNAFALEPLSRAAHGAPVRFVTVPGGTHFSILAPVSELLAQRIARGESPTELTEQDAAQALRAGAPAAVTSP